MIRPIRVALFAPGNNARVMTKAFSAEADAVILDLEDTVPSSLKAEARSLVAETIETQARQASAPQIGPAIYVRSNAASTGCLADDLAAAVRPGVAAVMLPKAESVNDVREASDLIGRHEEERGIANGDVALILQIESALGVCRCYDLIRASPRVGATCFASARDGDLQNDLGCAWSIEGTEMLYARSKVLLDTRAAGGTLLPLDGVFGDLNDEDGLVQDCRLSARLGYVGRTAIHPKQIAPMRAAYAVSAKEIESYGKVVSEFEAAEKRGVASIAVDGKLVDYAMYQRAQRVLELAKLDHR
jgi:citrate lyase subunit beta / citryl-CoA lyase